MANAKYTIQQLQSDETLLDMYPETTASQVIEEDDLKFMTDAEKTKLEGIESEAEVNVIESISINGTPQTVTNKGVNIEVAITSGTALSFVATTGSLSLKDSAGNVLSTVDLPTELIVTSGSYDAETESLILVLASGDTITIPVGSLIDIYAADESTLSLTVVEGVSTFKISDTYKAKIDAATTSIAAIIAGSTQVGDAAKAAKLSSAKTISLSGDATGSVSTDFSSNPTIPVTLANSGVVAGAGSAVTVNAKGLVTAIGDMFQVGTASANSPTSALAVGGLFFKLVTE